MLDTFHNLLHLFFDPLERVLAAQGLGFPEIGALLAIIAILTSIPWINIFRRAGYGPMRAYLMLVPIVNVFVFFTFAFGEWPIERELRNRGSSSNWTL